MERGGKQELKTCVTAEGCQSQSVHGITIRRSLKPDLDVWHRSVTLAVKSPNSTRASSRALPESDGVRLMNWVSNGQPKSI